MIHVTDTCKLQYRNCAGGKYDPTASPRRGELAPRYSVVGMNRPDGPEDFAAGTRSLPGRLPEFAQHQLPADRADAVGHLDDLRRSPKPRTAVDYSDGPQTASAPTPANGSAFRAATRGKYAPRVSGLPDSDIGLRPWASKIRARRTLPLLPNNRKCKND